MSSLVYLKSKSGTVYVYKNISYWDEGEGRTKSKRKCIGHLNPETGEVVPNGKRGGYQRKHIQRQKKPLPTCSVNSCGESLLFDKVCADIGLDEVLREVFPDQWRAILTCAYYLASEGRGLFRAEQWSRVSSTPYGKALTRQEIIALLSGFTPEHALSFFNAWTARHHSSSLTCLCIGCSLSGQLQGGWLTDSHRECPEETSLLVFNDQTSHLPLYCWLVDGWDISALVERIRQLPEVKNLLLVLDRRYYSPEQLPVLRDSSLSFVMELPPSAPLVRSAVERFGDGTEMRSCAVLGDEYQVCTQTVDRGGHPCWLHCCSEQAGLADGALPRASSLLMLLSNRIDDPAEALELYHRKRSSALFFSDLQNELDRKRLSMQSSASVNGRLFLQWIALMIRARVYHVMAVNGWLSCFAVQEVVDEMRSLCFVEPTGKATRSYTTVTQFQSEIGALFGLEYV